jgi:hypothetical protein
MVRLSEVVQPWISHKLQPDATRYAGSFDFDIGRSVSLSRDARSSDRDPRELRDNVAHLARTRSALRTEHGLARALRLARGASITAWVLPAR